MPQRLVFRRDARTEYKQAFRWYESQQEGLGGKFEECVEAALARIQKVPTGFGVVYRDLRKTRVEVYPYSIYFRVVGNTIRVVSVFHMSRDPSVWQSRADEEAGAE